MFRFSTILNFVNGVPFTKYDVTTLTTGNFEVNLQLPPGLTCRQCILQVINAGHSLTRRSGNNILFHENLQWTYVTGNRWGTCSNGTQGLGCGPQETFRACSDIGVFPVGGLVLAFYLFRAYIIDCFCLAGLFLLPPAHLLLNQSPQQQWPQQR